LKSGSDAIRLFAGLAKKFAIWTAVFVSAAVIGSYAIKLVGITVDAAERGRLAFIRRAALALSAQFTPPNAGILIPLALLFLAGVLLWTLVEKRLTSRSVFVGMIALLLVDLFWNSNQFDHTFDRSRVFPRTEITDLLHSLPSGRVLVVPSGLETNRSVSAGAGADKIIAPPNTLLPYRIPTVTGKNQQFPRWYREFASLIEPQPNLSHVVFDQYRSPFFDLLNVRYVMTHESATSPAGYDLVATAEGLSLYENKSALPRAFFARSVVAVNNPAESLTRMRVADFDPKAQTVIEGDLRNPSHLSVKIPSVTDSVFPVEIPGRVYKTQNDGFASITVDGRNWVVIDTDNPRDGLLVLSDNYYPGWSAAVDGVPTRILRANHTMRAVNVPAGRHLISFVFMPAAFFTSMYVSVAAAGLTLAALILSAFRRRSNSHDIRQDQKDS
jgi:hypothetical protein